MAVFGFLSVFENVRQPVYITKAAYLNYRKMWKKEYTRLARQIKILRNSERKGRGYVHWQYSMKNDPECQRIMALLNTDYNHVQSLHAVLTNMAHSMMIELEYAKSCARFSVAKDRPDVAV